MVLAMASKVKAIFFFFFGTRQLEIYHSATIYFMGFVKSLYVIRSFIFSYFECKRVCHQDLF